MENRLFIYIIGQIFKEHSQISLEKVDFPIFLRFEFFDYIVVNHFLWILHLETKKSK